MTSKALTWARKQGLNCEQDIMAETLRQQCRLTTLAHLRNWVLIFILLAIIFTAGKSEAWSPQRPTATFASLDQSPGLQPSSVRKALPTCSEYLEMDTELRTTGIRAVLTRVLGSQSISEEQAACMLDHVHKIDMTIRNICIADPMAWEAVFIRAVGRFAPHCGLAVSP